MIINNFYIKGKKIFKHWSPMQTEKSQPSGQLIMLQLSEPCFRHYLLTLRLVFLDLHQKQMIDSIYMIYNLDSRHSFQ